MSVWPSKPLDITAARRADFLAGLQQLRNSQRVQKKKARALVLGYHAPKNLQHIALDPDDEASRAWLAKTRKIRTHRRREGTKALGSKAPSGAEAGTLRRPAAGHKSQHEHRKREA